MTTFFWCLEYCKVLFAYAFIMFIWPEIVFRRILKGRSLTFHFGFCTTVQIVLVNTVVLLLGLFHVLNTAVFCTLFYGTAILCLIHRIPGKRKVLKTVQKLLTGTYGLKRFLADRARALRHRLRSLCDDCMSVLRGHIFEYGLLAAVVLFGVLYFSYGAFQDYSYGFGDMYPHNAWIYGLVKGEIFSAGVYPEGMHCFIYAMHTLFGIRIYSCLLFAAGIHSAVFLLSAYLLLKEVFRCRYSALVALTLFLTVDAVCIDQIYSMSRLQWTIPQEFALFSVFLCAAFLVRYLKSEANPAQQNDTVSKKKRLVTLLANENLFLFSMALAVSIVVHFYATIMAFFLCVAFVPVLLTRILRPRNLAALVAAVIGGCFISILPMAGALASGIPFQGSIGWAVNVINGTDGQDTGAIVIDQNTGQEITGNISFPNFNKEESSKAPDIVPDTGVNPTEKVKLTDRIIKLLADKASAVYAASYETLFRSTRAKLIVICTMASLVLFFLCRIVVTARKIIWKKNLCTAQYDHYLSLILSTVIFMVIYGASAIGIPELIEGSRVCAISHVLILAMCCIPFDALCSLVVLFVHETGMKIIGVTGVAAVYVLTQLTGNFHGYLYYELTRYNGAVMTTYNITRQLEPNSYTIVSTVDELYQLLEYGYHEELVQFINECVKENYTLPSKYVFIYLEKHPIEYAQSHFFTGPKWLATEKYPSYYSAYVSQCPNITQSEISEELGSYPYFTFPVWARAYTNLSTRTILESRIAMWCREFDRLYPGELHTYYEDDDFVCYYFEQNPACLYQLGFDLNRAE